METNENLNQEQSAPQPQESTYRIPQYQQYQAQQPHYTQQRYTQPQYNPYQYAQPQYNPYQYTQPQPAPKKKSNALLWVIIGLLIAALIGESVLLITGVLSNSVKGAQINSRGELVLTYSNGTQDNLGVVVGADGANGADGKNGADGIGGTTTVITENTDPVAISQGLRSAVSIFCTFTEDAGRWGSSEYYSAGSGVIYQLDKAKGDAIIVTNYHVVYDSQSNADNGISEQIVLYLYGSEVSGMEIEATYVGGSMYYDLAVLYVQGSELLKQSDAIAVTVANSDEVQVGATAIAIGNAEGEGISATSGVVSVDSEYITMTAADEYTSVSYRVMRIDTAVNSGNSGGGLFDSNGNLIGIVNAKTVEDGVENIGYALPSTVVVAVVDNIIDYCLNSDCECVMRPMLGVTVMTIASNAEYDDSTGLLNIVNTVEVQDVDSSMLGKALQPGDILVRAALNGASKELTRQHHLIDLLVTARVGDTVDLTVLRDGEEVTVSLTITEDCLTEY